MTKRVYVAFTRPVRLRALPLALSLTGCPQPACGWASDLKVDPSGGPRFGWEGGEAEQLEVWWIDRMGPDGPIEGTLVWTLACAEGVNCLSSPIQYGEIPEGASAEPADLPELKAGDYTFTVAKRDEGPPCPAESEPFALP